MPDKDIPTVLFEDDPDDRATRALREGLRQQAESTSFQPLDARTLAPTHSASRSDLVDDTRTRPGGEAASSTSGRPGRPGREAHMGRWVAVAAAGVAAVIIAVLVVPIVVRPQPIQAIPALTPTASPSARPSVAPPGLVGSWTPTAPPPISPRGLAVAAWVDGQFLVLGGSSVAPCPTDVDVAKRCDTSGSSLLDGARYDPATDTWARIADAPAAVYDLGGLRSIGRSWAVLNHTLYGYVRNDMGRVAMLAYDLDADRWTQFPAPDERATGLLVSDGQILVSICSYCSDDPAAVDPPGHGALSWQVFDQDRGVWLAPYVTESLAADPTLLGANLVDGKIVATVLSGPDPQRITMDVFDARTGNRIGDPARSTPIPSQRPAPCVVGEFAVWPSGGGADGPVADQRASFYSVARDMFTSVQLPTKDGPITTFDYVFGAGELGATIVTTDTMIALRGFLYDPVVRKWSPTPALPGPHLSPVLAGGGDYILDCFGYLDSPKGYAGGCHLLRPAPATSDKPTVADSAASPSATSVPASVTASPTVTPSSSGPAAYQGIDSANVESVTMSFQVGPVPSEWVVDLGDARAYTITPDTTPPRSTSAPRVLTDAQIADFRAMLDAAGVWSWPDWADANRMYAPAGNATVTLTGAGQSVTIDLGAPSVHGTDGSSHVLPGWTDFYNAMTALAGA